MTRLEEIRRRCESATPGPWEFLHDGLSGLVVPESNNARRVCSMPYDLGPQTDIYNGRFIAHVRTDLPALLAVVEAAVTWREADKEYLASGCYPAAGVRLAALTGDLIAAIDAFMEGNDE